MAITQIIKKLYRISRDRSVFPQISSLIIPPVKSPNDSIINHPAAGHNPLRLYFASKPSGQLRIPPSRPRHAWLPGWIPRSGAEREALPGEGRSPVPGAYMGWLKNKMAFLPWKSPDSGFFGLPRRIHLQTPCLLRPPAHTI